MSIQSNAWAHVSEFRWNQGRPDMSDELAELLDAVALAAEAQDLLAVKAHAAHESGMSWTDIADAIGITRQSASSRFRNPLLRGAGSRQG